MVFEGAATLKFSLSSCVIPMAITYICKQPWTLRGRARPMCNGCNLKPMSPDLADAAWPAVGLPVDATVYIMHRSQAIRCRPVQMSAAHRPDVRSHGQTPLGSTAILRLPHTLTESDLPEPPLALEVRRISRLYTHWQVASRKTDVHTEGPATLSGKLVPWPAAQCCHRDWPSYGGPSDTRRGSPCASGTALPQCGPLPLALEPEAAWGADGGRQSCPRGVAIRQACGGHGSKRICQSNYSQSLRKSRSRRACRSVHSSAAPSRHCQGPAPSSCSYSMPSVSSSSES